MQAAAKELGADYKPKANGSVDSMIGGFKLYSDICDQIKDDKKLIDLLHQVLTSACYDDKECRTLTIDFGHYIGSYYQDEKKKEIADEDWLPDGYTSPLSVDDWKELLTDTSVFTISSLQIIKRMKDYGGQATCSQLSVKYGETVNFYNAGCFALAKRIAEKKELRYVTENQNTDSRGYWWLTANPKI